MNEIRDYATARTANREMPMQRTATQAMTLIEKASGTINELAACHEQIEAILCKLEPPSPMKDHGGPIAPQSNDLTTLLADIGERSSQVNAGLRRLASIVGA